MHLRRESLPLVLAAVFLAAVLAVHLHFVRIGWGNSIGGPQDFRQSQTAIAAGFIAEEGPMLATKVPVLGPTWRIPFEFPVYQHVVAGWHRVTGYPLDTSGRLVSLACFYLCLLPLGYMLRRLGFKPPDVLLTLALVAASPIYLFWSRAFLIESMALLLSLLFIAALLRHLKAPGWRWLAFAMSVGTLAALTKFTTFSIAFGFVVLWLGATIVSGDAAAEWRRNVKGVAGIAAALLIPVAAGWMWTQYLQHVWVQSPLTRGTGDSIHAWNFGSWELRQSPAFWGRFGEYAIGKVTINFLPWLIGFAAFALAPFRWRLTGLCAFGAWLSGPLVWANLFYVHDYYQYATALFGLIWIASGLIGLGTRWPLLGIPVRLVLVILTLALLASYSKTSYHEAQVYDWGRERAEFAREVGARVPPEDVILVVGEDWNPMMAYYSGRYALMVRWDGQSSSEEFAEAVAATLAEGREFAGAIVRVRSTAMEPEARRVIETFNLASEPSLSSGNGEFVWYPVAVKQHYSTNKRKETK